MPSILKTILITAAVVAGYNLAKKTSFGSFLP